MKSHHTLGQGLALLSVAAALLGAAAAHASTLSFYVDLDTSALAGGNPAGPFFLDLQLTHVSGPVNTVKLSDFSFTGGAESGPAFTTGGAAGSIRNTVNLTETDFLNELFQGFTADTTNIFFRVDLTTNTPGLIPDGFGVAILDNNLFNLATNAPGSDQLVQADINAGLTLGGIATYSSVGPGTGGVTAKVSRIPDLANTAWLLLAPVGVVAGLRRRRTTSGPQAA